MWFEMEDAMQLTFLQFICFLFVDLKLKIIGNMFEKYAFNVANACTRAMPSYKTAILSMQTDASCLADR